MSLKKDKLERNKNNLEKTTQHTSPTSQNFKLLNEDQWSRLNEQIKQISLDNSKQHTKRLKHTKRSSPISTSAYGTGTTTDDTGQESPSTDLLQYIDNQWESKTNKLKKDLQVKSLRFASTNLLITSSNIFQKHGSHDRTHIVSNANSHFYTSTERLAEALTIQQKLLNNELKYSNNETSVPSFHKSKNSSNMFQQFSKIIDATNEPAINKQQITPDKEEIPTKQNMIPRSKKTRKSKSPSINLEKKLSKSHKSKSPNIKNKELEWVIKRRPDGTRYVTRRPLRSSHNSAIIKERRKFSTLHERYQSSVLSTTTDDDGQSAIRLMNERIKRRKNYEIQKHDKLTPKNFHPQIQQQQNKLNLLKQNSFFNSTTV